LGGQEERIRVWISGAKDGKSRKVDVDVDLDIIEIGRSSVVCLLLKIGVHSTNSRRKILIL